MRHPKPPAGNLFLLCTECDRGEWRRLEGETMPPCRFCNGPTERRYPLTLALREEDRGLLPHIAQWTHTPVDEAAMVAIRKDFRRAATDRARRGKPLPPWAVEWLQNNKEKPL